MGAKFDCEFAIRRFALVAVSTAVCAIVAMVVYLTQATKTDWIALSSVLAHVAVVSVLAILVLRKSRGASIALLVYLVCSWIVLWWLGHPDGWVFQVLAVLGAAVFLVFGSMAVLATFRLHARDRSGRVAGGIVRPV